MAHYIKNLGPFRSEEAAEFIQQHGLGHTIDQVSRTLEVLASQGLPIKKVELTLANEWDEESPHLRVVVRFDTDLVGAYEAWKDTRPGLTQAASLDEERGLIDFEFAAAQR